MENQDKVIRISPTLGKVFGFFISMEKEVKAVLGMQDHLLGMRIPIGII